MDAWRYRIYLLVFTFDVSLVRYRCEHSKINSISLRANNNNNNNNLYSCPEITQCRQIQEIKTYETKEHSHLEIAKLIELSGWAKRKKIC